jgi:GT2 family glycosyltransferase
VSSESPQVSIILVSWNRCEDLRIALDSIYRQEEIQYEVIVVDNGSRDQTIEFLQSAYPQVRVIQNPHNLGACIGKNQGILAAQADQIAFMDSDAMLLNQRTLAEMSHYLDLNPTVGAVAGPIYSDSKQQVPWVFGIQLTDDLYIDWNKTRQDLSDEPIYADALSTCFVMMPRRTALTAGGFDPVYFYQHEDLDFFMTVRKLGYNLHVLPGYPVWHRISQVGRKTGRWFWMHLHEEWRHQYLLIKQLGPFTAASFFFRNLVNSANLRAYYVRPIRKRKFVVLFILLPVMMLILSPWILYQRTKRPLDLLETK